jgi:membrane protease YdiL (CAAX protease family)
LTADLPPSKIMTEGYEKVGAEASPSGKDRQLAPEPHTTLGVQIPMGSTLKFFSLTYAVTWTCFIAAAVIMGTVASRSPRFAGLAGLLLLVGTFAPSAVALWLTARADGRAGTRAMLSRVLEWRVGVRWYVFAVGYMAAIKLAAALVHRVVTGAWPPLGQAVWYIIIVNIALMTLGQAGEEIGWRGYALPRLAARLGLAQASVLLGLIWACWHLPLFFLPGVSQTGQSFPVYLLMVPALSVAIAWLYGNTNGSLLLAMLMHAAINQTAKVVPMADPAATNPLALSNSLVAWLILAFLWIGAWYFLVRMPEAERLRPAA